MRTIEIREDVYERLEARRLDGERLTDTIERLLEAPSADWREGFGSLDAAEAEELGRIVSRTQQRREHD